MINLNIMLIFDYITIMQAMKSDKFEYYAIFDNIPIIQATESDKFVYHIAY